MIAIKWMMLCEFASVSFEQRINLLGVFDELRCTELPFILPKMIVVIDSLVDGATDGYLKIAIEKDGQTIQESKPMHIQAIGKGKKPAGIPIEFNNITFNGFGEYKIQVYFSDSVIHTGLLNLIKA